MIKESIYTAVALVLAFLLKGITYSVGNFSFDNSPLFSKKFVYDSIILLIYYILFLFVISKIRKRKGRAIVN